ncbi:hypothetical protein D3C71_1692070 [compost metagenome]
MLHRLIGEHRHHLNGHCGKHRRLGQSQNPAGPAVDEIETRHLGQDIQQMARGGQNQLHAEHNHREGNRPDDILVQP